MSEGTTAAENIIPQGKLEVIRKLLSKAERAGTEAEAETYNAKARELIARYGVDEAMLAAAGKSRDSIKSISIVTTAPYALDKSDLLARIANPLNCRVVMWRRAGAGKILHTIYGFESDLARVELLYTSLLVQAISQLVHVHADYLYRPTAAQTAAERRSWLAGFSSMVGKRLRAAEAAAAQQVQAERDSAAAGDSLPGVALVLATRRDQVDAHYEEQHPNLKSTRPRQLSGGSFGAGVRAGRRADIGHRQVGGAAARPITAK